MEKTIFEGKYIVNFILNKWEVEEYVRKKGIEKPSFDDCAKEAKNFFQNYEGFGISKFDFKFFRDTFLKDCKGDIHITKIADFQNADLFYCIESGIYFVIVDKNNIKENKNMNKIDKIIKENLKRVLNESFYDLSDDEDPYSYGEDMSMDEKEEELIESLGTDRVLDNLLGYIGGDLREKFIAEMWRHYVSNSF